MISRCPSSSKRYVFVSKNPETNFSTFIFYNSKTWYLKIIIQSFCSKSCCPVWMRISLCSFRIIGDKTEAFTNWGLTPMIVAITIFYSYKTSFLSKIYLAQCDSGLRTTIFHVKLLSLITNQPFTLSPFYFPSSKNTTAQ